MVDKCRSGTAKVPLGANGGGGLLVQVERLVERRGLFERAKMGRPGVAAPGVAFPSRFRAARPVGREPSLASGSKSGAATVSIIDLARGDIRGMGPPRGQVRGAA